jgi:acyl-coenzyme A thioesterase PaaI-like protein
MWKRLAKRPGGTRLFSAAAMVRVPYFASIVPHVVHIEPDFAKVTVPKWFFLYNHLHTVHAIASCNAAEMAMGMPDFTSITDGTELVVPVSVIDRARTEVVHADITCWLKPAR